MRQNRQRNIIVEEKKEKEILKYIKASMEYEEIPNSLKPENMKRRLESMGEKKKYEKTKKVKKWSTVFASVACMGVLMTAGLHMQGFERNETIGADYIEKNTEKESIAGEDGLQETKEVLEGTSEGSEKVSSEAVYEKIYDAMDKIWPDIVSEKTNMKEYFYTEGTADGFVGMGKPETEMNINTTVTMDDSDSILTEGGAVPEASMEESAESTMSSMSDLESNKTSSDKTRGDYGETNVQVEFVDEGDIVKNDGRYLYQLVQNTKSSYGSTEIQIVDTKDGLKELARIDGFENINEFYIYEDTAVIIETLWANVKIDGGTSNSSKEEKSDEISIEDSFIETSSNAIEEVEDIAMTDVAVSKSRVNIAYESTQFSKIYMYDISDREKPKEIHTFTLKGGYKTSRISDGYLYFFTGYSTSRPENKEDLEKYIPVVDGKVLEGDCLYLPQYSDATSYLVMTSIDMSNPTKFTDKMAAVTWGNYYYVSGEHIYILDNQWAEQKEGIQCDKTRIMKFSYKKGEIEPVCEGVVDGTMLDQFAMDEYKGYFRLITTVSPYELEKVVDDVTDEDVGYYNWKNMPQTNSVYVLDESLKIAGSIKNLAEEERVYSARFMGDTGYFVTFRQVDPLFSVDFSNPKEPKILGELKISGFSEYLHFYGENLLLGIGYEADEETGGTEGIKLSMFDVSNPTNVKEVNKLVLEEYDNSDALYNHHAVLVSVNKNLIGFMATGYDKEYVREYNTYSYKEEKGFKERFKIDCTPEKNNYNHYEVRGTYIGDVFYLLTQDGSIKAYNLENGKKLEELKLKK